MHSWLGDDMNVFVFFSGYLHLEALDVHLPLFAAIHFDPLVKVVLVFSTIELLCFPLELRSSLWGDKLKTTLLIKIST